MAWRRIADMNILHFVIRIFSILQNSITMKKNDFRIGNLIYGSEYIDTDEAKGDLEGHYSFENEFDVLEIESIEHDNADLSFMLNSIRKGSTPYSEQWNRLEPIKIDRGFLDTIGWFFEDDCYNSPCETFALGLNGEVWIRDNIETTDWLELRLNLDYFHELQNAFYLLKGKEILIPKDCFVPVKGCV